MIHTVQTMNLPSLFVFTKGPDDKQSCLHHWHFNAFSPRLRKRPGSKTHCLKIRFIRFFAVSGQLPMGTSDRI